MAQEYRNIYQIARESKGLIQEKASELMDISVDSLRAYEGDRRIPPDSVVIKMIEIYDAQYLAYQHMKTKTELGEEFLPRVYLRNLAESVLTFLDKCENLERIKPLMIKISCDGRVDLDEEDDWNRIMVEINNVIAAGIALKFSK